uniref:Uncharacterized protein n=1 Tax=Siphoviridae sp. ctxMM9 TaxID=2827973 RepID=A0A8S5T7J8_9CAUD|nr:MAG TPA: hypothetical protein [Siphoviridae sp. ctxMM9]
MKIEIYYLVMELRVLTSLKVLQQNVLMRYNHLQVLLY